MDNSTVGKPFPLCFLIYSLQIRASLLDNGYVVLPKPGNVDLLSTKQRDDICKSFPNARQLFDSFQNDAYVWGNRLTSPQATPHQLLGPWFEAYASTVLKAFPTYSATHFAAIYNLQATNEQEPHTDGPLVVFDKPVLDPMGLSILINPFKTQQRVIVWPKSHICVRTNTPVQRELILLHDGQAVLFRHDLVHAGSSNKPPKGGCVCGSMRLHMQFIPPGWNVTDEVGPIMQSKYRNCIEDAVLTDDQNSNLQRHQPRNDEFDDLDELEHLPTTPASEPLEPRAATLTSHVQSVFLSNIVNQSTNKKRPASVTIDADLNDVAKQLKRVTRAYFEQQPTKTPETMAPVQERLKQLMADINDFSKVIAAAQDVPSNTSYFELD